MDRYLKIKSNLVKLAAENTDIQAIIEIGSQARQQERADEYSDLDVILVSNKPECYLDNNLKMSLIGDVLISFKESTLMGATEQRILFRDDLDVDFTVLTEERLVALLEKNRLDNILARGYVVLVDRMNLATHLPQKLVDAKASFQPMSPTSYQNLVNDFWYHTVWSAKKIARGELWVAKMCIDSYLKEQLLQLIELDEYIRQNGQVDVWHGGRFLDKWAAPAVVETLPQCFASYDRQGLKSALEATAQLFGKLALEIAQRGAYSYPQEAENNARVIYQEILAKDK